MPKRLKQRKRSRLNTFTALAELLPGDVIHDVAPVSLPNPHQFKVEQLDAAEAKRLRKRLRRQKESR